MKANLIAVTDPDQYVIINLKKRIQILDDIIDCQKRCIKETFDNSVLDAQKSACINIAREFQFNDIAIEMEDELQMDKLILSI